jgi:hypothetical protein
MFLRLLGANQATSIDSAGLPKHPWELEPLDPREAGPRLLALIPVSINDMGAIGCDTTCVRTGASLSMACLLACSWTRRGGGQW